MSDLLIKCNVCGAVQDEEDLFCSECGTEVPRRAEQSEEQHTRQSTHNFICQGCGASMSYDAHAGALRCPFCGSESLAAQEDSTEILPRWVIPFFSDRAQAEAALRAWLRKGIWRPGDLSEQALVVAMQPVLIPYWVFAAETHTYWTADTSDVPWSASGTWRPIAGEHRGSYESVLVGTSSALTPAEMQALGEYNLDQAQPPDKVKLDDFTSERFVVPRKYARPLARQGLEARERAACARYVPGNQRNLKVNVRIVELTSYPILAPVWIMAYRYRDQVYRFLCNGQTGISTGKAPLSYKKIGLAIALLFVLIGIIVAFMLLN
ncbi:MAG: zinc ribbon domain-containing protein [Pirellulales bacterium]|nr:zinc ribbon domain-containing protein [Pirellulales bacterium]